MSQRHRIRHLVPERTKFEGRLHSIDDARDYDALHSNDWKPQWLRRSQNKINHIVNHYDRNKHPDTGGFRTQRWRNTSLPFPLSPPFTLPILPLEVGPYGLWLKGLGERLRSTSGFGWRPAAKRILVHFKHKFASFWVPKWRRIFSVWCPLKNVGTIGNSAFLWALYFSDVVPSWGQLIKMSLPLEVGPPRLRIGRPGGAFKLIASESSDKKRSDL